MKCGKTNQLKQGVALMGRNTTGPLRAAPGELRCAVDCYRRRRRQTSTTDARWAKQYWPPTLCV